MRGFPVHPAGATIRRRRGRCSLGSPDRTGTFVLLGALCQ
ncbi:hypothetical protein SERN_1241 [Serinibacter arcticus]|uniref:Uncharacterized protein n=1 Tax=Serinibacter arcticus TaxID=1655435 RepID=A0A4Z1E678_9MICO|nr:hypothetical protein SERN_1241 [Serinibacter arcticus]